MAEQIDMQIGRRVRLRRRLLNMTQQQLASACGVGFQVIHKYECGGCRISASRLWELSQALDVNINYFYEGLAPPVLASAYATPGLSESGAASP